MPRGTIGFFTIAPDGTVTADFSGHITAAGVDLLAGTNASPSSDRKISWHDSSFTGNVTAEEFSYYSGGTVVNKTSTSFGQTSADTAFNILQSKNVSLGGAAIQTSVANANNSAAVAAFANGFGGSLIDGQDRSQWLRFPAALGAKTHRITYGQANFTWAGQVVDFNVAHGLGVVPVAVFATIHASGVSGGNAEVSNLASSNNSTNIALRAVQPNGPLAGNDALYWMAIG